MNSYKINMSKDYLEHHGILGQKWGRKNGPPYPLDASDHSSSERKAGWRKSLDGGSKVKVTGSKTSSENRNHQLTDAQKTTVKKIVKAGAVAAATGLAVYGAYKVTGGKGISMAARFTIGQAKLEYAGKVAAGKILKQTKNFGTKVIEGIPKGINSAGDKLGKAVGFTVTGLAAKEVMDLIAGEKFYQTIETVYNSNHKKDEKLNFKKPKTNESIVSTQQSKKPVGTITDGYNDPTPEYLKRQAKY